MQDILRNRKDLQEDNEKVFVFAAAFIFAACSAAGADMEERLIEVVGETGRIVYRLDDTEVADDLSSQLPLEKDTEDFSTNEKIFYPDESLDTSDAPLAEGGSGTLAYYRPWGNVVMFYDSFRPNGSLFSLGEAVEGESLISSLSGRITIRRLV